LIGEDVCVGVDDAEEIVDGVGDGVDLETGRPSTAACSNGNDMELTFLDELRRVSVLMAVTTACCKEATLTSASKAKRRHPRMRRLPGIGIGDGKKSDDGDGIQTSWSFRAARSS